MKIKIQNVFEPEKEILVKNLQDSKEMEIINIPNTPNMFIKCKNNDGFPFLLNISKTACLAISFLKDTDNHC